MTTPDYKSIALRLYAHAKFAENSDRYLDSYWQDVDAIGVELGVADIENPADLGIPWPPQSPCVIAAVKAGLIDDDGTALHGSTDVITTELLALAETLKPGINRANALSAAVAADLASFPITDRAYADYSRGQPLIDRIKAFAILIS
jgi:hypothetical protein